MPLVQVAPLSEFGPGKLTEVVVGSSTYAVANAGGKIVCLDGICPHAGGPLGQGALSGDMIVCPWHEWEFNCHTGANNEDEDLVLDKYPVVVQNDVVFIDVPE
jgi:nitrite reductase/ring-hydroxylating ferredoxin subunit